MAKMNAAHSSGSAKAKAGGLCCYAGCGAELTKPLVCARCKAAAYCCKDCQVKDWKAGHKQACKGKAKASTEDVAKDVLRQSSGQSGGAIASALKGRALCQACVNGKMDMVDKLLAEGVSTDEPNEDGWTALMFASLKGHGEVAEKLLEKGASVDMQDKVRGREGGMWEGRRGGAGRGGRAEGMCVKEGMGCEGRWGRERREVG